mgnify:CR=1 FL=1
MARPTKTTDDPAFNRFYKAYPVHRDHDRAFKTWQCLSAKDRQAAIAGIASYMAACQQSGAIIAYPQGYLSGRHWRDKPRPAPPSPSSASLFDSEETTDEPDMLIW